MTTVSTSITGVGVTATLKVPAKGETVSVALSGTYNMTIQFQRSITADDSAWETIKEWSTANATVAYDYVTRHKDEHFRLRTTVDTSGTCTSTISDGDMNLGDVYDQDGNVIVERTQAGYLFKEALNGERRSIVVLDSATYTLNANDHAGRMLVLSKSGGIDIGLPNATGSGMVFEFVVGVATADAYAIDAFTIGADLIQGLFCGADDDAEFIWAAAAASNSVSLGGASQARGGTVGDWFKLTDVAAGVWAVQGFIHQGGTEATPFVTLS